jgi:hypothetical protein
MDATKCESIIFDVIIEIACGSCLTKVVLTLMVNISKYADTKRQLISLCNFVKL